MIDALYNIQEKEIFIHLKFFLIVAGTDANIYIEDVKKRELIKRVIMKSEKVISFNQEMINKISSKVVFLLKIAS